jgi:predicted  nucleic acid-binding Zn-ribbon protein
VSRTSDLYELQTVDLELAGKRAALAEVETGLQSNPALDELRERLREEQAHLAAYEAEQRDADLRTKEARERVGAQEVKLYGGAIHDTRELSHLQASLQQEQAALRRDEDELLQIMARVETAQAEIARLKDEIAALESQWEQERERLLNQQAELQRAIAAAEARRATVAARIRRDDLQTYTVLGARLGGRAVARVLRGTCQECHIALPTVVVQRARRGEELAVCSSCQRILYVS